MDICLREVLPQDSALLLGWRNDPNTRLNSINTAEVSLEEHARWFHNMITIRPQPISVAELDGLPVGVIRLDWNVGHDTCELSFTVAPEHRGKGVGFSMVQHEIQQMNKVRVLARVKTANVASRRIFDRLGFQVIESKGELLFYSKAL